MSVVHLDPMICCKLLLVPFRLRGCHEPQFTFPYSGARWEYHGKYGKL